MKIELFHQPCNTAAKISLAANESLTSEAGAMIAMDASLSVQTSTHKKSQVGLLKAVKRMVAGESFFLNHYTAKVASELWLSSAHAGDMRLLSLASGERWIVQSGSFLAAEEGIEIDVGWQGFKAAFSGESMFWLSLHGQGQLLLSAFGAVYEVEVDGEYIVDTGHIVAFEPSLNFRISKAGSSWWHSFLGGEGLICRFSGKGRLLCQSHNLHDFGRSLTPHLVAKQR